MAMHDTTYAGKFFKMHKEDSLDHACYCIVLCMLLLTVLIAVLCAKESFVTVSGKINLIV